MLDAVGRQKLVEEAAGKRARQVRRMLADLDPELARPADRVRPLGDGRYELKATIDAECRQGLEQLRGLLSHVDPRMTMGQLVGRVVQEALDRHDPGRAPRRARGGSRSADGKANAPRTPTPEQAQGSSAPAAKHAARPADTVAAPKTDPDAGHHAASTPESQSCASGRAISAGVRRQVWQRDGGRCSYVDPQTGRRRRHCSCQPLRVSKTETLYRDSAAGAQPRASRAVRVRSGGVAEGGRVLRCHAAGHLRGAANCSGCCNRYPGPPPARVLTT